METLLQLKKLGLKNFRIYLNPEDEGLSRQLLRNGLRETINSYYITKLVKKIKPHVLDIGGNIGYFPLIEVLSGAPQVTVFEPVSETYKFLAKNLDSFLNVTCYNIGLSDHRGEEIMHITNHKNMASMVPCKSYLETHNIKLVAQERVLVTTLNSVCADINSNNVFCRMDVEGYETKILKQVPDCIKHLSFEFHTKILGQKTSKQFITDLENMGFAITLMTRELEGLTKLFRKFGFTIFKAYNQFKEKRIYKNPTKQEVNYVISLERENPHIFMSR